MQLRLALFLLALPLFAAQSVTVTSMCPSACPSVGLPNNASWNNRGRQDVRYTLRITNISASIGQTNLGPYVLYVNSGQLLITNSFNPPVTDTLTGPTPGTIPCCSGRSDVMIQLQRDSANQKWYLTMCDTTGGNCSTATYTISVQGQASWATFPVSLASNYAMAWLRVFSTIVPTTDVIRNAGVMGDLADWEFEGSLVDSQSGLTFTGGTVSYSTTPTYPPSCSAGTQQSFITGLPGTLNGSNSQALDNGTTLTPTWTYAGTGSDGVTQSLTFGTASAITTTVSGYIKGSVNVTLTLVDGSANTSNCTIHDGAVTTNALDQVITGLPNEDIILGPMFRWGSPRNRAPWYDDRNKALADLQGAALSTNFPVYWNTPATGTVAFSPTQTCGGSTAGKGLIGTGTTFSAFSPGDYIVLYWNGGANRRLNTVASVSSNTCIILTYAWDGGTTESGQSFVRPSATAVNNWGFAQVPTPGNYYDNVKAYRALYERSGIDTYWTYYTTLADLFWAMPANDKGQSYLLNNQSQFEFTVRSQSLEGMILRAMDSGMSAMWTGIRNIITFDIARMQSVMTFGWAFTDQRDNAYNMLFVAYDAILDPDAPTAAASKAALSAIMPYYTAGLASDDSFPSGEFSIVSTTAAATVTNGSATVTCAGCTFTGMFPSGTPFVIYNGYPTYPPMNASYRNAVYYPTVVNPTTLMLDRPYAEASGSVGWAAGAIPYGVVGWGNQAFMEGIQSTAYTKNAVALAVSDPTSAALSRTYVTGLAGWFQTYGYSNPVLGGVGGMYYFSNFLTCAYPTQTAVCIQGANASQSRTDAAEVLRGLQGAYTQNPTAGLLAFGNTIYDQMYCKPGFGGTCTSDGSYITDLDDGQAFMSNAVLANKWLGFFFGYSAGINWPAAAVSTPSGSIISGRAIISGKVVIH